MLVAALTPMMELIPFSSVVAGISIMALGLGVLASDGAIALLALALSMSVLAGAAALLL
jgi:hypothetical protein